MDITLETSNSNDWITISLPAAATTATEREDFISFLKSEWEVRKSRFTRKNAEEFAAEVNAGWWLLTGKPYWPGSKGHDHGGNH